MSLAVELAMLGHIDPYGYDLGMSDTLPKVAERLFALLCGEVPGLTCNRSSDEDNAAWDYVVHFPPDPRDSRPRDEQPGRETAFVQVKSTDAAPFVVQLKLSNALRMAKESQPYFLVLVVGKGNARRILARHFWAEEIENTLRRVRQAEVSGHRDRLNRQRLTLRLSDQDDHTNDLLAWMQAAIRAVRGDYPSAKSAIVNSVGYEKGGTRFSVTLSGSPDEIVDWELGLRPTPTISSLKLSRERFGIELPDPSFDGAGYEISIEPNGQACLVKLLHRAESVAVTLAGTLYWSRLAAAVTGQRPWRADLGCLTLVLRSGELTGGIELDFTERMPLPQLLDRLTIAGWSGEGAVSATLFTGGARTELGLLDLPDRADGDDGWKEVGAWVRTLRTLVDAHPGNDPQISISDLMTSGVWLKRFHGLFSGASMRIEHSPGENDDPTHAIIYRLRCDVGAWCFFAIVRREVAVDTVIEGKRTLYLKPVELLEAYVLEGRWADNIDRVLPAYDRHVRAMGDPTYFWDMGDLEDWLLARRIENEADKHE